MEFSKRKYNLYFILNLIYQNYQISRTQLCSLSKFRAATVSEITRELLDEGYINEVGHFSAGKGRDQILLQLSNEKFCAVGVTVHKSMVSALISNVSGEQLACLDEPLLQGSSYDVIFESVIRVIERILEANPSLSVCGIGVATPGLVNSVDTNLVYVSQNGHQQSVPLVSLLEKRFQIPVRIESRVRMKALGEMHLGQAKDVNDFFLLNLGRDEIGLSIVSNGHFISGYNGYSGEIGHVKAVENGPLCFCGNYGCLEAVASGSAILAEVQTALERAGKQLRPYDLPDEQQELTFERLSFMAEKGDRLCTMAIESSAEKIGAVCATAVNLLNPQRIIFDGRMCELGDSFINPLISTILRSSLSSHTQDLEFRLSLLGDKSASLGAAIMVFETMLKKAYFDKVFSEEQYQREFDELQVF